MRDGAKGDDFVTESVATPPAGPGKAISHRNIVLFALTAVILLIGLLAADLLRARYAALEATRQSATTASAVVAEHVALAASAVDTLLVNIRNDLSAGLAPDRILASAARSHPHLRAVHLIDATGRVTASTMASALGLDVSGRAFFAAHEDVEASTDRLWFGSPERGVDGSDHSILPVSRRLEDADGRFAGIVLGAIDRDYLAVVLATQALGLRGTVGLYTTEGERLAGQVDPQETTTAESEGPPRIVATDRVRDLPLIVRVAVDRDLALAAWSDRAGVYALVGLGLMVLLGALSALLTLYIRRAREATEAAVARQVAERASRAKSDFVSAMSHELRTPIVAMDIIARDLEGTPLDDDQRSQVATLRASAGYLLSLVGSVIDLARVEAGRLELMDGDFSPDAMLDQIERLMMPSAAAKGLRLTLRRHDLPARAKGDAVRIQQILLNLIGNAIKYTTRGTVTVVAGVDPAARDAPARHLAFTVTDTGPGLPPALHEDAFQRFAGAAVGSDDSSGMGLSVAREICLAIGGHLAVEDTSAAGTTFRFTAPVQVRRDRRTAPRSPDADVAGPPSAAAPPAPADAPLSLLLAEDDPAQSTVFRATLSGWGHRVDTFGHGEMALEAARQGSFDALIVDINLPGLSGPDIVRRLRDEGHDVPVVGLTAALFTEDMGRYRKAGFDHLLVKPVAWDELRGLLAGLPRSTEAS